MTLEEKILSYKEKYGKKLAIVAHHYQKDEIVKYADITGDSLELARKVKDLEAKYIVFCGVYFMAESAAVVAREEQKIFTPTLDADCTMSNMAPSYLVEQVMQKLIKLSDKKIIPLTYVNSSAGVKAICANYGGTVCTSANAKVMLDWAKKQGDIVLFLPDKNLGQNTANTLGIAKDKQHILNIAANGNYLDTEKILDSEILLWPGSCCIHHKFQKKHILSMRKKYPNCLVYVHPESQPEVVDLADGAGSTSYLIQMAANAPKNSTVIIGTETSLVSRLEKKYKTEKNILPLLTSYCKSMGKTNETNLLSVLENLETLPAITVDENITKPANKALEIMLEICS